MRFIGMVGKRKKNFSFWNVDYLEYKSSLWMKSKLCRKTHLPKTDEQEMMMMKEGNG